MSRKQDDVRFKPSIFPSRDPHDDDLDHDFYFNTRPRPRHGGGGGGGARDEDLLLRRPRPSLSPQKGPRTMGRDPRSSISLERRSQYEQHIDCGRGRGHGHGHVVSRSPQIEHSQKRAHLDERVFVVSPNSSMRIQGEYLEYRDYDNSNTRPRNSYGYEDIEVVNHKDYSVRKSGASGHRPLVESIPFEDIVDRDVELLHPNYRYAARHMEPRGGYSTMDVQRFKDDKIRYQDMIPHEKLVQDVYYKDNGEQYAYYTRESPRESPLSQIKDLGSKDLLKNNPSTSTGIIVRGEHITKLRDCHTKSSDGYPKRYGKDLETFIGDDYGQIVVSDTRRGYGSTCRDAKCHACEAYKSSRVEHNDNMYHEIGARRDDEIAYTSQENMFTKTKYVRENRDMREFLRQDFMDSTEIEPNTEGFHSSQRIIKNVGTQEYDAIQKDMALDYRDTRQSSDTMIQPRDYLDSGYSHVEMARKVSNHHHIPDLGSFPEYEFENPCLGKVHGRYAPDVSNRIRVKNSSDLNNLDTQRVAEGYERIKADDPRDNDRFLKRKYIVGEDVRRVESRGETHSKCNMPSGNDDFHDYPTEWTGRKTNIIRSKRPSGYEGSHYVESEEISDGSYHHKDSTNVGWTSYHDQSESTQEHSEKPFKMGSRHLKGYKKTEFSKSYGHMCHSYSRSNHYKHQDLRQKYENYNDVAIPAQAAGMSDNHVASWKSEPSEDSDDFKQRIQSAFLDFSKRFNENPTARKLYKEEGKAGSLFCVVCRRSASKEFLDTKALATHAFMSHKVGVRPQHLGLHRAICVLMGWNTMPDPNTGTWAPEQLPKPEALEQKEDLILWPPVVIVHNISLSNNDHNKWKLVNIDALEEFLRGKGFHLGKMKICLGNPGDHSVILVKFLGTFSGLQEAERLHKLFMERKHGRVEFDQAISGSGPADDLIQGADQSEKLEDVLLYGYMGISEDLDNIDFDTKKRCSVKSKKEIHELADAPVKPE